MGNLWLLKSNCYATIYLTVLILVSWISGFTVEAAPKQSEQSSSSNEVTPLEKSVQPFYTLTEQFLDFIQPVEKSNVMPEVVASLLNGSYFNGSLDWNQTSRRYATSMLGYAILISFGVLFTIGLILTGCIVFSCRCCCGKCGGRLRPMEAKRAKCRRIVYGILLTLLTTVMLCGLVLAFISNQLAHSSLDHNRPDSAPRRFAVGLAGAADELDAVPRRARNASAAVMAQTVASLSPTVHLALLAMQSHLVGQSGLGDQLERARKALGKVIEARRLAGRLKQSPGWSDIADAWSRLNDTLSDLLDSLPRSADAPDCPLTAKSACQWLLDRRASLRISQPLPEYEQTRGQCQFELPTELTNPELDAGGPISILLTNEPAGLVTASMIALERELDSAKSQLNNSLELQNIWSAAEAAAANASAYLRRAADAVDAKIINPTNNNEQTVAAVLTSFDRFRFYLCIGLACLAVLVVAFYYFGLAFGFCGEPPYEDSRCCNKGVGANMLLTGTGFAFLFGWLIMIFVMAFFVTGALFDTEVCRHLTGRAGAAGYKAMDDAFNELLPSGDGVSRYTGRRLFSGLFGDCADAAAAGRTASFASALNLSELLRASRLENRTNDLAREAISALRAEWSRIADRGFTRPDSLAANVSALAAVVEQAGNKLGSDAAACAAAMDRGPLSDGLNAKELLDAVKQLSDDLSADPAADAAVRASWTALASRLTSAINAAVDSIADKRDAARGLSRSLSAVYLAGRNISDQLRAASTAAIKDGRLLNSSLAVAKANLTAGLSSVIRNALGGVFDSAANCAVLGGRLREAVRAPCVQLLQPLNGYWAGLGLFLLCLLPAVVLACKLANLYRKTSKYQKDYQEPQGKPKRRKPSGSREKSRASQQLSGAGVSGIGSGGGGGCSSGGGGHQRDSTAGASAVNRQSQRYSQLPPYAQEAYDY